MNYFLEDAYTPNQVKNGSVGTKFVSKKKKKPLPFGIYEYRTKPLYGKRCLGRFMGAHMSREEFYKFKKEYFK